MLLDTIFINQANLGLN